MQFLSFQLKIYLFLSFALLMRVCSANFTECDAQIVGLHFFLFSFLNVGNSDFNELACGFSRRRLNTDETGPLDKFVLFFMTAEDNRLL